MRKYFHLPTEIASFAVLKYINARSIAMQSKKELLDREGAIAILRQEHKGIGLIYQEKKDRSGFTLPTKYEQYWLIKPKKNTIIGKRIQTDMNVVCQNLEKWQWALEDALNLYESVYSNRQFELTVCFPMPDGSVLVSQPKEAQKILSQEYQINESQFNQLKGISQ